MMGTLALMTLALPFSSFLLRITASSFSRSACTPGRCALWQWHGPTGQVPTLIPAVTHRYTRQAWQMQCKTAVAAGLLGALVQGLPVQPGEAHLEKPVAPLAAGCPTPRMAMSTSEPGRAMVVA